MINDIQHMIHVFANLAVASTTALCLMIGVAGTLKQSIPFDCVQCRAGVNYARLAPAPVRTVTLASIAR
ncbi:MAG: hypothetical protein ABL898_05890 [Hyphomicrobiaceae bacterium]|nr:hypothetical protein [Hyphomicrobiaceae bacterium]